MMFRWFEHPHPRCIPRRWMPQIEETDYPELLAYLSTLGVRTIQHIVGPNVLRPHQELDELIVTKYGVAQVRNKVVLVSNDDFILDGNHRWMLHRAEQTAMRALVIDRPFEQAIGLLFDFPQTYRLELGQ